MEYTSSPTSWAKVNEEIANFVSEGWELVSVCPMMGSTEIDLVMFFKRTKA